jgi:hypothetical protein
MERSAYQAGGIWLRSLGLLVVLCLTARFAIQAAQATLGSTAPDANGAVSDESIGDGVLPTIGSFSRPLSLGFTALDSVPFHLPAVHKPIPHPPQLVAA